MHKGKIGGERVEAGSLHPAVLVRTYIYCGSMRSLNPRPPSFRLLAWRGGRAVDVHLFVFEGTSIGVSVQVAVLFCAGSV